jgi:hypothetical protein
LQPATHLDHPGGEPPRDVKPVQDVVGGAEVLGDRGGETVADPIVQTDPVEEHHCRLVRKFPGEHFGVVSEVLLGHPIPG